MKPFRLRTVATAATASALLCVASASADEPISFNATVTNANGQTVQGKQFVDAAHPLPVAGGGGGGSSGGTSTAANPTYSEGATGQSLSLNLSGELRTTNAGVGATGDAAWSGSGAGSVVSILKLLHADNGSAIPTGANTIGKVGIDQSSNGGTNAVNLPDGNNVTLGTKADAATCATANTAMACFRQLHADVTSSIPAGSAVIGKVGIDQTTPGSTNGTQDAATSATGSAAPAKASYVGAVSGGNLAGIIQADTSTFLNMSTAATTQIVGLASGKKIYVTMWAIQSAGTSNVKFVTGTGSNCGTGTADVTANFNLTAGVHVQVGAGLGPVLVVPASQALCVTNSAAVVEAISIAYTQF